VAGSLVIVGTGIRAVGHLTVEAISAIKSAEELLYLVTDPAAEAVMRSLGPVTAESLRSFYADGKARTETYAQIVERIMTSVRGGRSTCVAFYGHPGVFVLPSHQAIRMARAEGYEARMLPAVSAEDCLFSDLGIDPADGGCQSYEATDFLVNPKAVEPSATLILWQVGILADWAYREAGYGTRAVPLLLQRLAATFPLSHPCRLYEAAQYPGQEPMIASLSLWQLAAVPLRPMTTLCVPPVRPRQPDYHMWARLAALGIGVTPS
jgi:hypothetical protein